MSVRNGMDYLEEAVDSIVAQTFTDWEFVIVDNASTDDTLAYLEARAAAEPRIVVIPSRDDLGVATGRNLALAYCRGEWIARMDADDRALPNRFERQLAFVRENPDVDVTSSLAYYIDAHGRRVAQTAHDMTTRDAFHAYMDANEAIGLLHPGVLARRDLLVRSGGYRADFVPAEDLDLWNRLTELGAVILVQPELLMEYRIHGSSIMAKSFALAHDKHQWAIACIHARRRGEEEPSWEQFLVARKAESWPRRLNRWRDSLGRRLYREAGYRKVSGQALLAGIEFCAALSLRPVYAATRLRARLLGREHQAAHS
jgi:glycosyltransferase involved in cell wall biosynthesis